MEKQYLDTEQTAEDRSPIEDSFDKLFGKIERAEMHVGRFIAKTKRIRVESGAEGEPKEVQGSVGPISTVEEKLNEASARIESIAYRAERALSELRL